MTGRLGRDHSCLKRSMRYWRPGVIGTLNLIEILSRTG